MRPDPAAARDRRWRPLAKGWDRRRPTWSAARPRIYLVSASPQPIDTATGPGPPTEAARPQEKRLDCPLAKVPSAGIQARQRSSRRCPAHHQRIENGKNHYRAAIPQRTPAPPAHHPIPQRMRHERPDRQVVAERGRRQAAAQLRRREPKWIGNTARNAAVPAIASSRPYPAPGADGISPPAIAVANSARPRPPPPPRPSRIGQVPVWSKQNVYATVNRNAGT